MIFGLGAPMAFYEGVEKILHAEPARYVVVNYIVLGASIVFEAGSWFVEFREFRHQRRPLFFGSVGFGKPLEFCVSFAIRPFSGTRNVEIVGGREPDHVLLGAGWEEHLSHAGIRRSRYRRQRLDRHSWPQTTMRPFSWPGCHLDPIRRGMRSPKVRFAADSSLEGDGFELVVPRCVVGGRLADAIAESAASLRRATALGRDDKREMPRNPRRAPNLNRGCAHADRSAFPSRRIPLHQAPVPIFWRGCR